MTRAQRPRAWPRVLALLAAGACGRHAAPLPTQRLPVTPEIAGGYPGDPAHLARPLRQDLTALTLQRQTDGTYDVSLPGASVALRAADLRTFVPRVPRLARGDATLTRIALFQRELNRNETDYGASGTSGDVRVANNCLRQGLWEVIVADRDDAGARAVSFHGWFTFPPADYARLFEQVNAVPYAAFADLLARYPTMGGFAVPLDALRSVEREAPVAPVAALEDAPVAQFAEQARKAHLVLSAAMRTYGDFHAPAHQPIAVARFSEPGYYNPADPMRFDLAWLAHPTRATWRRVRNARVPAALDEVEVDFANGYRLLLGDARLEALAARAAPPTIETDALRVTFGIGTPEIVATAAERVAEYAADVASYALLLDAHGDHVDNHAAGLDRVYLWRGAALHLLLVGYERIALFGELTLPWSPPAP